jgi:nitrous oxide reductase accessory protein NosL
MRVSATDLPADSSVTVTDWETCRPLAAKTALVVLESDLVPCCSPAAICFADRTAAQAFRKRHGGRLASWDECRAGWAVGKDGPDR